jgi:hypothetical protein
MSVATDIADAVVAELNAAVAAEQFSQQFTAARAYVPEFDLRDLCGQEGLRVAVAVKSFDESLASRSSTQTDYAIDVAVIQKVENLGNTELDPLMDLVQAIADFFRLRRLASYEAAMWHGSSNDPPYSQEHLREKHLFLSVLTLTYRVLR